MEESHYIKWGVVVVQISVKFVQIKNCNSVCLFTYSWPFLKKMWLLTLWFHCSESQCHWWCNWIKSGMYTGTHLYIFKRSSGCADWLEHYFLLLIVLILPVLSLWAWPLWGCWIHLHLLGHIFKLGFSIILCGVLSKDPPLRLNRPALFSNETAKHSETLGGIIWSHLWKAARPGNKTKIPKSAIINQEMRPFCLGDPRGVETSQTRQQQSNNWWCH